MINPILIKINDFPFAGSEEEEEKLIDCVYGHRGWRLIKKDELSLNRQLANWVLIFNNFNLKVKNSRIIQFQEDLKQS